MAKAKKRKRKPAKKKPAIRSSKPKKKVKAPPKPKKKKRLSKTEKLKAEVKKLKEELKKKKKIEARPKVKPERSIYRVQIVAPPEGFELIPVAEGTLGEAADKIRHLFQTICDTIDINCHFRVHPYPVANEVDGELVVVGVDGIETTDVMYMIQEVMLPDVSPDSLDYTRSILGIGFWMTVGIRWQGTGAENEDQYKKWHGLIEVSSNYRSMSTSRGKINSDFAAMTMGSSKNPIPIVQGVEQKFGVKSAEVFLKIVWNNRNQQPARKLPEESVT